METPPKRPRYRAPAQMTERIEVRCTPEEKDAIYAAAMESGKGVARFIVETQMEAIRKAQRGKKKGASHE